MTQVWCAKIFSDIEQFAPYQVPAATPEERNSLGNLAGNNKFGYSLSKSRFPLRIFSMRTPPVSLKHYAIISSGIPVISPSLLTVLQQLDCGASQFYPLDFFEEDGVTPLGHQHRLWNLANRKDTLVPSDCRNIHQVEASGGQAISKLYANSRTIQDDDLVVREEALSGPDFWIEEKLLNIVFFSASFEKLMNENGFQNYFEFKSVRVV